MGWRGSVIYIYIGRQAHRCFPARKNCYRALQKSIRHCMPSSLYSDGHLTKFATTAACHDCHEKVLVVLANYGT